MPIPCPNQGGPVLHLCQVAKLQAGIKAVVLAVTLAAGRTPDDSTTELIIGLCSESSQGPGGASAPSLSPNGGRSGRVEDSEPTAVMLMAFAIKFAFKVFPSGLMHLHARTDTFER